MRGRSFVPWLGIGLAVLLVVVVAGSGGSERTDRPLDPTSAGPRGARGVVVLLDELGADVSLGGDLDALVDTALLLNDTLDDDARGRLVDWVEDGGVLVVADPFSPLHDDDGYCPGAISNAERLSLGSGPGSTLTRGERCFDGFVSAVDHVEGTIVSLDEPGLFANGLLGKDDNAVLAADLLAPTGDEEFVFVAGRLGSGQRALPDLLGPRAAQAIVELGIAFVVYALWRARRLGKAVVEPQPVAIAGSELVAAVGRLHGSRKRPEEGAATIRADLVRALEIRLGVAAGSSIDALADAVASRTGLDAALVAGALARRPVLDEADLLEVVADLDRIRALAITPPATAATTAATVPGGT